jgi:hypothetical protein
LSTSNAYKGLGMLHKVDVVALLALNLRHISHKQAIITRVMGRINLLWGLIVVEEEASS